VINFTYECTMTEGMFIKIPVAFRVDSDEEGMVLSEFILQFRSRRMSCRWFDYVKELPYQEGIKKTSLLMQVFHEAET
jgi:hypothetical protein